MYREAAMYRENAIVHLPAKDVATSTYSLWDRFCWFFGAKNIERVKRKINHENICAAKKEKERVIKRAEFLKTKFNKELVFYNINILLDKRTTIFVQTKYYDYGHIAFLGRYPTVEKDIITHLARNIFEIEDMFRAAGANPGWARQGDLLYLVISLTPTESEAADADISDFKHIKLTERTYGTNYDICLKK